MRVVIYSLYAINTPHFETELELAQLHLDAGDELTVVTCDGSLASCDVNVDHRPSACTLCRSRADKGLASLQGRFTRRYVTSAVTVQRVKAEWHTGRLMAATALEDIRHLNLDAGMAALSSCISIHRNPDYESYRHGRHFRSLLATAISVYEDVRKHLESHRYDIAYLYNGRYAPLRGILRAVEEAGVEYRIIERGSRLETYHLWHSTIPHSIQGMSNAISAYWADYPSERRLQVAHEFFANNVKGISLNWKVYTLNQEPELLPAGWDPSKRNIAIYVGSEDEFAAISDEYRNRLYSDQCDGLARLRSDLGNDEGLHLYVRVHPNLSQVDNTQTRQLATLTSRNMTVIPADSPVSSYALLSHADAVLTFGSTVGIEAAYWGRPSILCRPSPYGALGSTYNPSTHAEVVDLLRSELEPLDKLGAMKFGLFYQTFGTKFKYYKPEGIYRGTYRGRRITPGLSSRLLAGAQRLGELIRLRTR
jgi:hypothetical protein